MSWGAEAETYHSYAVGAAVEGMRDPGLGPHRIVGPGARRLAEAAVTSATPFVRAPVLAVISAAAALHAESDDGRCGECRQPSPCRTARTLGLTDPVDSNRQT